MKLSSRRSRLLLSGVVAGAALSGLTVAAAPAYAAGPHISVIGGPGEILVQGGGFNADATVRIEALTPDLSRTLDVMYVKANWIGYLDQDTYLNNLGGYTGNVYVAADGAPGPTAWATTRVNPAPFIDAYGRTPPYCDGTVDVYGYNFQRDATVRVDLLSGFVVMDTFYATVNQYGGIWYPYELFLTHGFDGPVTVVATEYYPYGQTASASLSEAC